MNGSPHNGQSSPLGLLPPADFGGTPRPFGFASRLRRETLLQRWSHQIPLSGNPLRSCHNAGNPTPDTSVGKPSSSTGSARHNSWQDWLPPGSPVAYGGKPAPKLPQRGEPAQGTSLCCAGFTARRCLLMTND
ncbi:hypothetical protein DP113_22000 [Brasilonema octagenarum UFV-E1]|uniref:Uncharacterized protein n=1 Tax=Brasilonema sennae CENA114 TaxID=415709 RepID=A0A856MFW5_9CYAN|nr:hypothetical protein DP114_22080 [Brasilonema sennae CENA114]QDL16577.1 hypothetical protein DP113_22000 [Brasilonema octagenarum UFV-E1]